MLTNTSATGGFLAPTGTPPVLEGKDLNDFFHDLVVGITGLTGPQVRQRWQVEPPNIPQQYVAWCAIGIANRRSESMLAQVIHDGTGNGSDKLTRHETLELLASFYDTGTNGRADDYACLLRDGLAVAQNREVLQLAGMGLADIGELVSVPSLVKTRWLYRVDVPFQVRRAVDRVYPVENIESLDGVIRTDTGLTKSLGG